MAKFKLGIKVRTVLNWKLSGLHENVQNYYSRCLISREIPKILGGQSIVGHPVVGRRLDEKEERRGKD